MSDEYRLMHFNSARPLAEFSPGSEYFRIFVGIMPRIFKEAKGFEGLHFHQHGLRSPTGEWFSYRQAFKYPVKAGAPEVSTMAAWSGADAMMNFAHGGKTHPPAMRRMSELVDRSNGPIFVMWWAKRGEHFTLEDGWQRLLHLREHGSSEHAFSLTERFASPAAA